MITVTRQGLTPVGSCDGSNHPNGICLYVYFRMLTRATELVAVNARTVFQFQWNLCLYFIIGTGEHPNNKIDTELPFDRYRFAYQSIMENCIVGLLVDWLCFTSQRQRNHLEMAPPLIKLTVLCKGREARFSHHSLRESTPGLSRGSLLHYRCATPAQQLHSNFL